MSNQHALETLVNILSSLSISLFLLATIASGGGASTKCVEPTSPAAKAAVGLRRT
jgi:hypothetical protein